MNDETAINEPIELLGFKGKITRIVALRSKPPFREKEEFAAVVEFEPPHPVAILETWFCIPVKDYSREELLETVKKVGEEQLAQSIETHNKAQEQRKADEQRQKELDDMARKVMTKFQ